MNRNVVRAYQNLQRKRWMTENESEGRKWEPLNPTYAKAKRKKWAAAPGGGRKMLIASGKLYQSVIGPGEGFRKVATPRQLIISTSVEYAVHVNEARPFTRWSRESIAEFQRMIKDFIFKNKLKVHT